MKTLKSKAPNPKQIQNSKLRNSKTTVSDLSLGLFEFVLDLEIRN